VEWLREQATESLTHAQQAGEMITHLGAYPSLTIGPLLDTHRTDIGTILRESLASEGQALALYKELLLLVEGKSVMLEEYAGFVMPRAVCGGARAVNFLIMQSA
jgi:bacterioferritin